MTLIEYIVCRLEKMNNERAYCAPRFSQYALIWELAISLTVTKDNERVSEYEDQVILRDVGLPPAAYPNIGIFDGFFAQRPHWRPEKIKEALQA